MRVAATGPKVSGVTSSSSNHVWAEESSLDRGESAINSQGKRERGRERERERETEREGERKRGREKERKEREREGEKERKERERERGKGSEGGSNQDRKSVV